MTFDSTDRDSILQHALKLENRTFVDVAGLAAESPPVWDSKITKGSDGRLIESYFGVSGNSDAGPDLAVAGIEIKTVPVVQSKRRKSSKERTVITMANYFNIANNPFAGSTLDIKTRLTLYVFFLWGVDGEKISLPDRKVLKVVLHERSPLDLAALNTAYSHVQKQVQSGKAHLLSEGDTSPVGACTKGRSSKHLTNQPFSTIQAKPRAFAWRPAYTTELFAAGSHSNREPDVANLEELVDAVAARLLRHQGKTAENLRAQFAPHIKPSGKGIVWHAVSNILKRGEHDLLAACRAMNISVKTTRVDPQTRRPHEGTSFSPFSFVEVHQTPWDESNVLTELGSIIFVVFESNKNDSVGDAVLQRVVLWQADSEEISCLKREYEQFRAAFGLLPSGEWPKASETRMLHVRPHTSSKLDQVPLPRGGTHVRSSFWLNPSYVQHILNR